MASGFNLACVQTPFPQKKSEKSLSPLEKCKFFDSSKMAFQQSKKPPFEKTTSNDKTKVSFTERQKEKMSGILDQNHGYQTKVFITEKYVGKIFLSSEKKTTLSKSKTKVSLTEKQAGKIFGILNHPFRNVEKFSFFVKNF